MADHPLKPGPPPETRTGWPYQPADHGTPGSAGPALPPWAEPPPPPVDEAPASPPPPAPRRSRAAVLVVAVSVVLLGVLGVAVVTARRSEREVRSRLAPTAAPSRAGPATTVAPAAPGSDLVLLGGRAVVAARPGWKAVDSTPDFASVSLVLHDPAGRPLVSTMSVVTLSGPGSLDTTLAVTGGTGFEVAGVDGPLRVTAQPGRAARLVLGAVRPRATFFLNVSIFARDGQPLELAALQTIATEQLAPTLRFP